MLSGLAYCCRKELAGVSKVRISLASPLGQAYNLLMHRANLMYAAGEALILIDETSPEELPKDASLRVMVLVCIPLRTAHEITIASKGSAAALRDLQPHWEFGRTH